MSLKVHPDPQEPAGGYAFLELPEGSLSGDTVLVSVFDAFGERWLSRPDAPEVKPIWQTVPVEFGPYEVHRHQGADWVRLGPEIVDRLEEYAPLRITIAGVDFDVIWPDDVPPRASAAVSGALQPVRRIADVSKAPAVVAPIETPVMDIATPVEEPDSNSLDATEDQAKGKQTERGHGKRLFLLLLCVLAVIAAVALYFWSHRDPELPEPVAGGDGCSRAVLAATPGGYGAIIEAIRTCGVDVQPDTALSLVEEGAAAENPEALLLFGTLYDGETLDARIENLTGLTFADDPAKAAEYYARAVSAGAAGADARLGEICKRLSLSDATLSKGAYDDYCS